MAARSRVLVLTDISSLTPRVREPDDGQSLIRLLLFANEFDIEGIVASSNMGHGQTVRPELIHEVIDAYEKVHPSLSLHRKEYPAASALRAMVKSGQPVAGPKIPYESSVGKGKDTPGSDWIIRVADKPDPRPLWILIWGGSTDLAQALWRVRSTRSIEQQKRFIAKLRVHSIYDQDSAGPELKREWPDLFYITRHHGVRGMYRGGDSSLVSSNWVTTHVSKDHGALAALYPNYIGGDIWSRTLGPVRGIKEGDSPSFLFLFPNGLNQPERPELGGWGGRMLPEDDRRLRWIDADDGDASPEDPDPRMSAVYRWRADFQNEMESRLDWCVKQPKNANHPPEVRLQGNSLRQLRPGAVLQFDVSRSHDPDGDRLDFDWNIYPPIASREMRIEPMGRGKARLRIPSQGDLLDSISVVVYVRDTGTPALSRYVRIELSKSAKARMDGSGLQ